MKWYNWIELFAGVLIIVWFVNLSLTDYSAGILIYKGFLPEFLVIIFPIVSVFLLLFCAGASVEDLFGGKTKVDDTKERVDH